ncbi:ABC transporter permease/M1 family aminopeptidase [Gemmatimonas groenlandica]|uniref:ABC transporter permease subunit n=1 Tax=Gemmatimonas groenlandica TaxID=2732249 RepID=A0A6M4IKB8_9BACT|nr:M1 family aminopeptidase [Gemmatimonas groenlandica]QJR34505.1 ABC transporter permease subunit [Gemmatimonas groenlandica]
MFGTLFAFELRGHFRRPATWLYVAIVFLLAFFAISTDAVLVGPALGKVKRNSPYALAQMYAIMLAIGQIITSALVGTTVLRDYEAGVHELLFTTRITRAGYLAAKYVAALIAMLLVFSALPVGALLGTLMPWIDGSTVQSIVLWHYIQPFLAVGVPGVFFISSMLFAVGSLTRSSFAVYVCGILLLVGYSVAGRLVQTLDRDQLANLIDPFALRSIDLVTRYWTPVEKNARTLPLDSFLGANRLLWVAVGVVLLVAAFRFMRLEKEAPVTSRRKAIKAAERERVMPKSGWRPRETYAPPSAIVGWWGVTTFHIRSLIRSVPFLAIAAIGFINVLMSAWFADQNGQNRSWPMSWLMAETSVGSAALFMVVLLTFYAGELVWRERQVRLDQVLDASPVRTVSVLAGKFTAMMALLFAFGTVAMLGSMTVQVLKGYPVINLGVYALYVYGTDFPGWFVMVALAFLVQSLVPRKPIGHVIVILIWVANIATANLGYDYRLLQIAASPAMRWSDLNATGPYLQSFLAVHGFNLSVAAILLAVTYVVWHRGTAMASLRDRLAPRLRGGVSALAAGGAVGATAFGGLFYYNASIVNPYFTRKEGERRQVAYERTWRPLETLTPPKVVATSITVDLQPTAGTARTATSYTMVNRLSRAIDSVLVNVASDLPGLGVTLDTLRFDRPHTVLKADTAFGVQLVRLATPLAPGDSLRLRVVQHYARRGFPSGEPDRSLVENGTFFNRDKFPTLGYGQDQELQSDELRRKYKLPLQRRGKPRTDVVALQRQSFSQDADFVSFEATVSTDPDQIAMAPGYLQKEWASNGRRYFHYVMDKPMPNFFSVLSARWTVTKTMWRDVPVEVYHYAGHTFNVARMLEASKASLEFFSNEFGVYPHRQLRILEFPRYAGFAQSFPNTVPYSEAIGFVARVDSSDVEDTDLPYFVTAHEIAHQWFPYQRMPADVEGAQMLSESLSEYAALVVTDRLHGRAFTQKFLRAELERYLRGRAGETKGEHPLTRVDLQAYIWYQKGSLALFALRDLIGESALHGALRAYLDEGRFAGPPYATTLDLMKHIRAATPDSMQMAVDDYFETITLWDVKTDSVLTAKQANGQYKVTVVGTATKFRADSLGTEAPAPLNDYIDVGVFAAPKAGARIGAPLAVRKIKVTSGVVRAEFIVKSTPARAGIDPYNLLIDRVPSDNSREVRP